ncbi:MAG: helicase C-terminal domain-containing protein [Candidatus Dormibacteria bacterium]
MATELVAFDLETTGLSPKSERVIEVGAVRFGVGGESLGELQLLVDPGIPVPLPVQRLTGISTADLAGQPSPVEAMAQLAGFCEGAHLVGHGAAFDLAFCSQLLPATFGRRGAIDTLELARILLPLATSHNLGALSRLLGLRHERPHRALSDAQATAALLRRLLDDAASLREVTFAEMRRVASQADTPLRRFFELAAAEREAPAAPRGRAAAGPAPGAAEPTPVPAAGEEAGGRPPSGAGLPGEPLADAAVRLIGPGGPLAERPGHEYREAQEQMARAVAQSLERGGRLLVEAGTGVGKTLGYLAPLALWIERGGGRGVVATNTVTLQEQLATHDLPTLQPHLPRPLDWAMLKGRSHYISLRRFQRHLRRGHVGPRGPDLETIRFTLKLLRWLDLTRTGDRAELHLTALERELWRAVESTADDCLGSACANWRSGACHMVAARRAAATAELVVTNHALLLSDEPAEGRLLGDYDALVVDEAHHLEEQATRSGGHRLRAADLVRALDRIPGVTDPALASALDTCRDTANGLFGEAKGLLTERLGGGGGAPTGSLGVGDELLAEPRLQPLLRNAHHAILALRAAASALRAAGPDGLETDLLPQPDRGEEELALAAAALEGSATAVDDVLLHRRPGHVAWLELRAEQAELHDAPVAAGAALGPGILDAARTVVLTSATLAIAGDFGFVRERLGLGGRTEELALASPFDYLSQALCVVVTDIPPYDDPDYEQALAAITADIARRLGGRTLGLFTGYGALRRIHDQVGRRLAGSQIAVLGQGLDGTRRQLLTSFRENPRTLLLGTGTFWEGIDVPGDALQCVIIAKLPFAVPTDPLVRARTADLPDPFRGYVLPEAVIRLRQGFGRLIRSGTDRGAVVIADSRLQSRDYARRFLEALPPAAVAREPVSGVAARVAGFVGGAAEGGESVPW